MSLMLRIAGQDVHLRRPEVFWFGECEPLAKDPQILVDPRLPSWICRAVALHEIAHVRARSRTHGVRFRRALSKLWQEEHGLSLWTGPGELGLLGGQILGMLRLAWKGLKG